MLEHQNFLYIKEKTSKNVDYYKCKYRSCKARGIVCLNNFKASDTPHNHENDQTSIIRLQARQKVVEKAKNNPTQPASEVYNSVINTERKRLSTNFSNELIGTALPTFLSCRSSMIRSRREVLPAQPQRREDIIVGDWCLHEGENFLLINDGEKDRIMAFGTRNSIRLLAEAKRVFMDGTFYVCPSIFAQFYTLHVIYGGKMLPVVYALLPDKTEATYTRLLEKLTEIALEFGYIFKPEMFTIDFEQAVINAIHLLFPNAEIKGCFFHFTQCIWKKTQAYGLQAAFEVDEEVTKTIKRLAALPLLNPSDIEDTWMDIHGDAPPMPGMQQLIEYFVSTWLDPDTSLFDINIWNIYGVEGDRTNNRLEGWHSGLKRLIKKAHPNLFEFVDYIKQDYDNTCTTLLHITNGSYVNTQRRIYRKINLAIRKLTDMYNAGQKTPIEFLDSVSYKLHLKSN
ncbi:hypothetical protein JTE90_007092 [Oedothorax gibbosus]|uniref:MULE transposase domain-containing protein n=1 Tax=Oedothorax gibbosus TaxID=931172 RepID=A0AAV6VSI5_9ARAC|nr:hypothetical protein JTE90_007092 [Oedothorax gibbosus]